MIEPTESWVEANGLRHHVLCWNEAGAETIVLCHGFLDLAWSFHPVAQCLAAAGMRVLAFDWRGHGESARVGSGGYYHFTDYVLDLHDLLRGVASGPVHLVGHSMGGTAVALYAGTFPGRLRTVTLVEGLGPPAYAGSGPEKMATWIESMDRARGRTANPMRDIDEAMRRLRLKTPELSDAFARFVAEKATEPAGEGLRWRFDPLHRTTSPTPFTPASFLPFLERIDVPTLIVSGEHGFRTTDHEARVAALPSAREVVIPKVGHMIHWLAPDALGEAILAHVRVP